MLIYQQKSPSEALLAFNQLYQRYSEKVFSYLLKKCKNQADAEDLLQKTFIKMHESKHLYKEKFKFEQWIFVIARTIALDHFRSQSRYEKRITKAGMDSEVINEEEVILDLDADQREMLEMKYIDQLSYQEMSKLFKKSEVSLRKMVSRLVIGLRKGEV